MADMDLENIRKDIDSIDSEITALFKKRMDKTLEVAKYKKAKGIPVLRWQRWSMSARNVWLVRS